MRSNGSAQPRTSTDRHEVRIGRLQGLLDSELDLAARNARHKVWNPKPDGTPVQQILIRSRLLLTDEDHPGKTRIQAVSHSKSAALQLLLLMLFEAQVRPARGRDPRVRTWLPIRHSTDERRPAWVTFMALPTADLTSKRAHSRTPTENRERQVKQALDRLADLWRVELGHKGVHGRYENFVLLNEGTTNARQAPTEYTRPGVGRGRRRRAVVTVPVEFFLNNWVDALTDNEIITYLVLRLMTQAFPDKHREGGVFLSRDERVTDFNLDRGFDAHRMLYRYGLITTIRDDRRNADGTMKDFAKEGAGNLHRFQINDSQLNEQAIPRVIKSLTEFVKGYDVDLATTNENSIWRPTVERRSI